MAIGLSGAALLYGDGMITPAISVLSAVEGTEVVTPALSAWVRTGRQLVGERLAAGHLPVADLVAGLSANPAARARVPGTAVFLFSVPGMTPPALIANLRYNEVLHEQVVVVSVVTDEQPRVPPTRRADVVGHGHGVTHVVLHYGFVEEPDVPLGLTQGATAGLGVDPGRTTYFLGAESLVVTDRPGMAIWRERLFALLSRNATSAANYFGLPADRTVVIGTRVEL